MKLINQYNHIPKSINKKILLLVVVFCLLGFHENLSAQDCNCTIADVENNTVSPCQKTIGSIIKVNSVSSFRDAINYANSRGGNITILIEDGNYQVANTSWYPYITASNVVIRSASGNRNSVILRGGGMRPTSVTENIFLIGGNNVTIADMTLQDCGNHAIQVSGANLFVHNVYIKDTYEQMIKGATSGTSIDSAIVQCSKFEYTAGIGPNYYIGGLDIHKGTGWTVRDNVFKYIKSPSGSIAEHAIHFWSYASNNLIERNQIINCDRGIGFGLGSSPNNGGIIRNNMIYHNGEGPFADVGIGLESSPNTKVYNNSIYLVNYFNAIEYRFISTVNVDIKNNLTNKSIRSRDGGQATLKTNITTADPSWFVNLDSGDLRLVGHTPSVVDMGTSLTKEEVADDIFKTSRPQGDGFDVGAHELLASTMNRTNNIHSNIMIFPNPNSGQFAIQFKNILAGGNQHTVEIYSSQGKKFYSYRTNEQEHLEIDISNVPKGIYLVKILDGMGSTHTQKIRIQEAVK